MSRVITALVLLPPLVAIVLFAPAWVLLLLTEVVALLGVRELFEMSERNGYRAFRPIGYLATAVLAASFYPGSPPAGWVVMGLLVLAGLAAVGRGAPGRETTADVAITVLGPLYAGLLIGTVVGLRVTLPETSGRHWVVFLLAVIMLGDTGAYYVGKSLGKRRLAPSLSPNKTVEGFIGGIAASLLAAVAAARLLLPDVDLLHAAILGAVLSLLGVVGDLFESLLKRAAGVKNSSALMPGHGGVLDRLDSLYFSAPALLFYVRHLG
jgi:phosphatidate cytidylyltransferase